ncbi:MAG: glycerate kinase [Lachnospiraceae bacterium]|nr:glycerate kinase [Lachnospiraceae bacterium]
MNHKLRHDAEQILRGAIRAVTPDTAVKKALEGKEFTGRIYVVAVGKAAWRMAQSAVRAVHQPYEAGIVITKYGHTEGEIPGVVCYEAGHPIPDENSFMATQAVLDMTADLKKDDTVLFLLSGGGSALFERPLISGEELGDITEQLLASGADIVEMNTIRKRLSAVKGGKFAKHCEPAHIEAIILSDIIGDPLDMIASGPAYPDSSTCAQALEIADKYGLKLSDRARSLLGEEPPKGLSSVTSTVIGNVKELCRAAMQECKKLGYEPILLTDCLNIEARVAGAMLSSIALAHSKDKKKLAFIAGGETIVHRTGKGKGGRNQELALGAAAGISGLKHVAVFSVGSDGTDGPTDAAGGYVDGDTMSAAEEKGLSIEKSLQENDSYTLLGEVGGLIITGPTGTNVNDVAVVLIDEN